MERHLGFISGYVPVCLGDQRRQIVDESLTQHRKSLATIRELVIPDVEGGRCGCVESSTHLFQEGVALAQTAFEAGLDRFVAGIHRYDKTVDERSAKAWTPFDQFQIGGSEGRHQYDIGQIRGPSEPLAVQ